MDQIAEAFCSHRFVVTYPYMADEIKWNIVGSEELIGREAIIDRCDKSAKFLRFARDMTRPTATRPMIAVTSPEVEKISMAKQPEFHKYLPLEEWFRNQSTTVEHIELTFDQVEAILGSPLPKSATKLTTWWTNVQPKIQSHRTAWLNNGWKVSEFDQQARWVRFIRA